MRYLDSSRRRYRRTLLVDFLPLLFLLASCSGGGGGGGGGTGVLSVDLAFAPGDGQVTVNLVEKGPLVRLLNISTYQLTAIDSGDETMRVEGVRLAEGDFNGSTLMGLTNDHNYTFALRVFYFPILSAELSNLSLRIDYAEEANSENVRAAGGITIGIDTDGDYLANLVDADDDNDGLNDLDANGAVLDECPRGDIGWQRNETTDNDGDGCQDAGEDRDDDNDGLLDGADSGTYMGRECRLFVDCDNDTVLDDEDLGDFGGMSCRIQPDCDGDRVADAEDLGEFGGVPCRASTDCDGDGVADAEDLGEFGDVPCRAKPDCDGDRVADAEDLGEFGGEPCRIKPDCDGDRVVDAEDLGEFGGVLCRVKRDCDGDRVADSLDYGEYKGESCRVKPDCDNDGEGDESDIDIDGDGLIEIGTAAELDAVRHQLDGSGQQLSASGALDRTGCGNGTASGDISACNGYELVRNISLAAYATGAGWEPLGHDASVGEFCEDGGSFSGVFDGNGFTISDLNINRGSQDCIGFFAYTQNSVIRNLSVEAIAVRGITSTGVLIGSAGSDVNVISSSVKVEEVSGDFLVGGLMGIGLRVKISSSSVVAGEVRGSSHVGGLVGDGDAGEVVSSSVVIGELAGDSSLGGLVGNGQEVRVVSSSVEAGEVTGTNQVGGLVGYGQDAEVASSFSDIEKVTGNQVVGGLVGYGFNAVINSSSAVTGSVNGATKIGGLVGEGSGGMKIVSSSSVAGAVNGSGIYVGGLVGLGDDAEVISSSSVAGMVIGGGGAVGGLAGGGDDTKAISSFSVVEVMRGGNTGGLVGWGDDVKVVASFSVTGEMIDEDNNNLGGLVGLGDNVKVISSYSVAEAVRGLDSVGGLVGDGDGVEVVSSLTVAGEVRGRRNIDDLLSGEGDVIASYWHTVVSDATNSKGEGKTLSELRTPTNDNAYDMGSIYANWTRGADIDGTAGVDNITIWCDEDLSDEIEADEMRDGSGSGDDNRIWDFGGSDDYPAIRCAPLDLAEQRSWWFINVTGHPNLNRTRLDALLP